jgi:hypothetical protein
MPIRPAFSKVIALLYGEASRYNAKQADIITTRGKAKMAEQEGSSPVEAVEGIMSPEGERIEASRVSLSKEANDRMNQLLESTGYPKASMDRSCFVDSETKDLYFRFFEETPTSKAKTVLIAKVRPEHWNRRE